MYLLDCWYSLDSKTEKCLEMGWNCQNTLGSIVSYRILRESKWFTLSRFEKWVSYVPTRLFVFSWFENRKMSRNGLKLSEYVRKYCFLSHTSRIKMFYSLKIWEVGFVCTYYIVRILVNSKTEKCLEMGWNCQNKLGSIVSYRILRESKCFTLSRFKKWVSYVPTGLFVFSLFENRKMSRDGLKLSKYVRKYCFLSHTSRIEMFYSFKIWEVGFVCTY